MEALTTIIHYTSNSESETFVKKVQDRLLAVIGNLPLISVSQKPMNFGKNICVGDIGAFEQNVWKQMLVGCEVATTPFVTFTEADTLYPPGYFRYQPKDLNKRYWFEDVYILYHNKNEFYLKGRSDCAHMAGREYVTRLLKEAIAEDRAMKYKNRNRPTKVQLEIPIVNIKTGKGMRPKTQVWPIPQLSLPYWGEAKILRKEFFEF